MKRFTIKVRATQRGYQVKVSRDRAFQYYYRYFQSMDKAMCFVWDTAKELKAAHPRCETINLIVDGQSQGNLLETF